MSTFATILVTTDFSEQALPALDTAAALARRLGSEVILLHVVEDELPPILLATKDSSREAILEDQRVSARSALQIYADRYLDGCKHRVVTEVGVPAREIARRAEAEKAELVVIASRGYGPIRQLMLGSTAERVLHRAPCPVLVVPSKPGAGGGEAREVEPPTDAT